MRRVQRRPSRTLPVAVLDGLLAGLAAVRALARRTARLGAGRIGAGRIGAGRIGAGRIGDRVVTVVVVVAALAVVAGTGFLVAALLRAPEQLAPLGAAAVPSLSAEAGDGDGRTPGEASATAPASSPLPPAPERVPSPVGTDTTPVPPPPPPPPAALLGRYATENVGLLSYTASVTITNQGGSPAGDWTLVLTLPRQTQSIGLVDGAQVSRDGATWTFVPDQETRRVPAGGSVQVRFRVDGALLDSAPTTCAVDGRPCEQAPAQPHR